MYNLLETKRSVAYSQFDEVWCEVLNDRTLPFVQHLRVRDVRFKLFTEEYESILAKLYEGYVRHCVQMVHDKLKNATYATASLVEKSHKLFLEKAIVENTVRYKELVYQAMRNVPVRMKDRLTNEMESYARVSL